jgi:hypothetical protein
MDYSSEKIKAPACPRCGVGMRLYRSELVKFVPAVDLHFFTCPTCPVFAECEMVREPVWAPVNTRVPLRFFSPMA